MEQNTQAISRNDEASLILTRLASMTFEDQERVHRQLSRWLNKKPGSISKKIKKKPRTTNSDFFKTELGKYILQEADPRISIEEVRATLSKITAISH